MPIIAQPATGGTTIVVPTTTAGRLAEINAAISAILNGAQEYQISNRRVRRAELNYLLGERKRLEACLASENGTDIAVAYLGER